MKILTKEEEQAHYNAVLKGGSIGAVAGLAFGGAALALAQRRYAGVRNLTIPLKAFLVSSSTTVVAIINADKYSRAFQRSTHAAEYAILDDEEAAIRAAMSTSDKVKSWAHENRYMLVVGSWAGSISAAWWMVNRDKLLSASQKIVQARMYAQGLTLGVICAMAAFEVADQRRRQKEEDEEARTGVHHAHPHVEKYAGEDLWKDMVASEERRENRMRAAAIQKLTESKQKGEAKP